VKPILNRLFFALAALCAPALAANFTSILANHIQDASGNPLASGQLCVQGVALNGQPIPFQAGGGGIVHTMPVCTAITNGAIGGFQVADSSQTFPLNVAYSLTITDNTSGQSVTLGPTQITGSAWSFDAFQPSTPALALVQTGPQGPPGPASVVTSNGSNGDFSVGGNLAYSTIDGKPSMSVLSARFGAKGDGVNDDGPALQACINWSQANFGSCYLPPAKYRYTTGLIMPASADLRSDAPYGQGGAQLWYYNSGTALTVGTDVSHLTYAATLQNIGIVVAPGFTAQCGIAVLGLSEAHWSGVSISGNATGGKFTTSLRMVDTGAFVIDGLVISNQENSNGVGTTAVLFDNVGALGYGNNNVVIKHADIFFESKVFDVRSCDSCHIQDSLNLEGFDYLFNFDDSASNSGLNSLWFQNNSVTADEVSYFSNRKIANINVAATNNFFLYQFVLSGNRFQMTGGVDYGIVATVNSSHGNGVLNVRVADNSFIGVNQAVVNVSSATAWAHFNFGQNHVNDATGTIRTPDIVANGSSSAYFLDEASPTNTSFQLLTFKDRNGTDYRAGSSGFSMTRPAAGAPVPGAIYGVNQATTGNNDGFIRVGTLGGALPSAYASYCDWFGSNADSTLSRSMTCLIGPTEEFRMDATQVRVSAVPLNVQFGITAGGNVTASGFVAGSSTGVTATKTAGACTFTITGGIITAVSGC
jgi:hypothetical protein